jgi:hypothetical protein
MDAHLAVWPAPGRDLLASTVPWPVLCILSYLSGPRKAAPRPRVAAPLACHSRSFLLYRWREMTHRGVVCGVQLTKAPSVVVRTSHVQWSLSLSRTRERGGGTRRFAGEHTHHRLAASMSVLLNFRVTVRKKRLGLKLLGTKQYFFPNPFTNHYQIQI